MDLIFIDLSGPYPTAYEPKEVERGWYQYWEQTGLLHSEAAKYETKVNLVVNIFFKIKITFFERFF